MVPKLIHFIILAFFILFSCVVSAADIPDEDIGAQELQQDTCVGQATEHCIDTMCLTSEDTDCEDNCGKMAQDKCQQQRDE